jgi:hypothetical protein
VIDASSLDCAFRTQSVLENPSDEREEKKQERSNKIVERPTQTEPWYFREPTVAGRAMYAFQENKTDKSQDIAQSMEPKPNQTPLFHILEGLGTSHRKNIFQSLET